MVRFDHLCRHLILFCSLCAGSAVGPLHAAADNWPQWRGPLGNNTTAERDLPIVWGEDRGIVWKCPLPPWGHSTVCGVTSRTT